MTTPPKRILSRRQFLALTGVGAGAVGLVVLFRTGRRYLLDNLDNFSFPVATEPNGWLQITPAGTARLMMTKAEMGQGIQTALAQIVADELYLPLKQIEVVMGDSVTLPSDAMGTSGSTSVATMFPALRKVAAQAREMLKTEAARMLGVGVETLTIAEGVVSTNGQATELSYGSVVGGKQIVAVAEDAPLPLKPRADFTVIGQAAPRVDIPAKVVGGARYGYDARLPGMQFGKVLKPPTLDAKFKSADTSAARQAPGVIAVVEEGDFVGVIAATQEAANAALALIAAQWEERSPLWQQAEIEAMLVPSALGGEVIKEGGDVNAGLRRAAQTISADYATPFATHATLEPQAGLAHVRQENGQWRAEVWTATQIPTGLSAQIARTIGLKTEDVIVYNEFLGGGFGRKVQNQAALEAARLSKAIGQPVRVNWDRSEEFQHGYLRPPVRNFLSAGLDAQGRIVGWDQRQVSGLVLFAFFPAPLRLVFGSDFGATRGAVPAYTFENHRTTAWYIDQPVATGSWRGLGLLPNVFAVESFMDELAQAAGQDPLAFRLAHLGDEPLGRRLKRVLEKVTQRANWSQPLPIPASGWKAGRGLACSVDAKTVVAQVAEVAVNEATGAIKVERVYCALDCGLVINPDGVRAQIEGNVMWGVGSALVEELTVVDGKLSASNFGQYPLLTIRQAPEVVSELIDNPEEGPYGIGEPPLGPVAAAVSNAVFNATGKRLRRLPLRF